MASLTGPLPPPPMLPLASSVLLLLASGCCGFSGIVSGSGKASCEGEGGVCFTQGACCEDFSCERVTTSSPYGRCTSRRASMRLAGDGNAGGCHTDADCPAATCCLVQRRRPAAGSSESGAATAADFGSALSERLRGRCGECTDDNNSNSMESLFNQYYSAMLRKRFH